MKTKLLWLIPIIIIAIFIYKLQREIHLISVSDPDYNSVYSSNYSEKNFNETLIGKNEKQLIQILGEPLSKTSENYTNNILYTDNKDVVFLSRESNCIRFSSNAYSNDAKYRMFQFDSIGKVVKVKVRGYSRNEVDYEGLSKADILKQFGTPNDEVVTIGSYEVLSFSDLKNGELSGKTSKRYVRKVLLNKSKVAVRIIKDVVDMHSSFYCLN
jgi:hypothetical protein